jgi:hypothetical protein
MWFRFPLLIVALTACVASLTGCARREPPPNTERRFVGSDTCATCHQDIYTRWKDTLMRHVLACTSHCAGKTK